MVSTSLKKCTLKKKSQTSKNDSLNLQEGESKKVTEKKERCFCQEFGWCVCKVCER